MNGLRLVAAAPTKPFRDMPGPFKKIGLAVYR